MIFDARGAKKWNELYMYGLVCHALKNGASGLEFFALIGSQFCSWMEHWEAVWWV